MVVEAQSPTLGRITLRVQRDGRSFTVEVTPDGEGLVSHPGADGSSPSPTSSSSTMSVWASMITTPTLTALMRGATSRFRSPQKGRPHPTQRNARRPASDAGQQPAHIRGALSLSRELGTRWPALGSVSLRESRGSVSASTGHAAPAAYRLGLAASSASGVIAIGWTCQTCGRGDRCPGQTSASAPARRALRGPPAPPAGYG